MRTIIILVASLVLATTAASANCLRVDDDADMPTVVVSGRVVTQYYTLPEGSEARVADGPFLKLDKPLTIDPGTGCRKLDKIVIMNKKPRTNSRVTIKGRLVRFGSALVVPPIYIDAE